MYGIFLLIFDYFIQLRDNLLRLRKGEPFQQGKAQKGSAQRAAGERAAPLSDRSRNKTGGKNDLKIKGTLKPTFSRSIRVCVSFHEEGIWRNKQG